MKALWKGQGTLVAHILLRPRRVAPPLGILLQIHEFKS